MDFPVIEVINIHQFFCCNVCDNLYFQDECELDEELPSVSGILGKKTVIDLSDESADQLEPVFPVIPPTSFYSSQSSVLEEFRNIKNKIQNTMLCLKMIWLQKMYVYMCM